MTERKAEYLAHLDCSFEIEFRPSSCTPPPDNVLATLEAIREVVHEELARIERDGGCAVAWLRVEALVAGVLR